MKKVLVSMFAACVTAACLVSTLPQRASAADTQADRVAVMYFHRTECCAKGRMLEALVEETVKREFSLQVKEGRVQFLSVDFEKDEKLAEQYKITGPALVVAKIRDNKLVKYTNFNEFWARFGDKAFARDKTLNKDVLEAFVKSFREAVWAYLR